MTEAPDQARDTLLSLHRSESAANWQEFKEWFHLFHARRQPVADTAKELEELVERLTWTMDTGFEVKPVVILDTTTANIDLENESDNSQVGAAMSVLKQSLPGIPIVLIGHTPKAVVRANLEEMTFRGAGAWEAEANATYYLVHDRELDARFLAIQKARFTPSYREISFDREAGSQVVETSWGEPQHKHYLHGVPARSNGEARTTAREEAREERKVQAEAKALTDRQERALHHIDQFIADNRLPTKTAIISALGGKRELAFQAIERLIDAGTLERRALTKDQIHAATGVMPRGQLPEVIFPSDADFDGFFARLEKGNQ